MNLNKEDISKMLKDKGLIVTNNRLKIISCLNDEDHHFHAISDISKHIGLNKKSIYNNIKLFIKHGIVDSYSVGGVVKYALNDNINNSKSEIHTINFEGDIDHMEIPEDIFKSITKEVKKQGKTPTSVKIYVNVE